MYENYRRTDKRRMRASFFRVTVVCAIAVLAGAEATVAQDVVLRAMGGSGFANGYRGGFGGSLGIEFPLIGDRPFFLGARVMRHVGSEMTLPESLGGPDVIGDVDQLQYGLEFGATWVSSPIIVRTSGGIGIARLSGTPSASGGEALTSNELVLGPGVLLAVPINNRRAFVGLEAKFLRIQNFENTFAVYGTVGIRLGP